MPQSVSDDAGQRPLAVDPRGAARRDASTLMGTIALVVLVIFLFLRRFVATVIPTLVAASFADRRGGLALGPVLQPGQHLARWA